MLLCSLEDDPCGQYEGHEHECAEYCEEWAQWHAEQRAGWGYYTDEECAQWHAIDLELSTRRLQNDPATAARNDLGLRATPGSCMFKLNDKCSPEECKRTHIVCQSCWKAMKATKAMKAVKAMKAKKPMKQKLAAKTYTVVNADGKRSKTEVEADAGRSRAGTWQKKKKEEVKRKEEEEFDRRVAYHQEMSEEMAREHFSVVRGVGAEERGSGGEGGAASSSSTGAATVQQPLTESVNITWGTLNRMFREASPNYERNAERKIEKEFQERNRRTERRKYDEALCLAIPAEFAKKEPTPPYPGKKNKSPLWPAATAALLPPSASHYGLPAPLPFRQRKPPPAPPRHAEVSSAPSELQQNWRSPVVAEANDDGPVTDAKGDAYDEGKFEQLTDREAQLKESKEMVEACKVEARSQRVEARRQKMMKREQAVKKREQAVEEREQVVQDKHEKLERNIMKMEESVQRFKMSQQ